MKNKNIWLVNQYIRTPDQPGGTRHYSIGRILVSKGYNLTLFGSAFSNQMHRELKCERGEDYKIEVIDGVRFIWIKTISYKKNNFRRVLNMLSFSWRCLRVYKKLLSKGILEKPEVVIGSTVHLFAVLSAYLMARSLKSFFLMEVRDLWPMTLVEFRKGLKYHPLIIFFGFLECFLARRAKVIISVLPRVASYYEKMGIDKSRIVWIPNGVDISLYRPFSKIRKEIIGEFKVLYTGTLGLEANIQTLLSAAKILQEKNMPIKIEIVGAGERKGELIKIRDKMGLENVSFCEPVIKSDIPALLSTAEAFWIGSRDVKNLYKYGYSFNKLFEYLASGRPVLFSINAEYNPVSESGAGFTVPPGDEHNLAHAIIKVYKMSSEERRRIGNKGIAFVEKYYDFKSLSEKFHNLVCSLE